MQFVFDGTLDALTETIFAAAREQNKDILLYDYADKPGILEIGFQRCSHSGGRFFLARVSETDTGVILQGEITDVYNGKPESKARALWTSLQAFALFYVLAELALMLVWLPIFRFSLIWIPLVLPVPVLLFFRILAIREQRQTDADFVAFMSGFTAKYCPYLKEYIDEGSCLDLQLIGGGYIKASALPEMQIDKAQASRCCKKCRLQ